MFEVLKQYGSMRTLGGRVKDYTSVMFVCMKDINDTWVVDPENPRTLELIAESPNPEESMRDFFESFVQPYLEALSLEIIGRISQCTNTLKATTLVVFLPFLSKDVCENDETRQRMEALAFKAINRYYHSHGVRIFLFGGATSTGNTCANLFAKLRTTSMSDVVVMHGGYGTAVSNMLAVEEACRRTGLQLADATVACVGYGAGGRPTMRLLAPKCKQSIVVARDQAKMQKGINELNKLLPMANVNDPHRVIGKLTADLDEAVGKADVLVLATNSSEPLVFSNFKKTGLIILNPEVPSTLAPEIARHPLVLAFKAGELRIPGKYSQVTNMAGGGRHAGRFPRPRLRPDEYDVLYKLLDVPTRQDAKACTSEQLVLCLEMAHLLRRSMSVSQFCLERGLKRESLVQPSHDMEWLKYIDRAWKQYGFQLSNFRSDDGEILEKDFARMRALRQAAASATQSAGQLYPAF